VRVAAILALLLGGQMLLFSQRLARGMENYGDGTEWMGVAPQERLTAVQQRLESLAKALSDKGEVVRVRQQFQETANEAPRAAIEKLRDWLGSYAPASFQASSEAASLIASLRSDLERLHEIYSRDLAPLLVLVDSPPWYLWPGAVLITANTELRSVLQLNQALHLARVGKESDARQLLAEIRGGTNDRQLAALGIYLLARLNYEQYRKDPEVQHYNEAVRYTQESLQSDPDLSVAKRFLDFLLSFDESPTIPRAGEGRARIQTQGDEGAIGGRTPRF
jgi:hypothetical protein